MTIHRRTARRTTILWAALVLAATRVGAADLPAVDAYADRVVVRRDVPYADKGEPYQKLDLYLPKGDGPFPLVVCWFGGGFTGGDKGGMARVGAYLASRGFAAATPNYFIASAKGDRPGWPRNVRDAKCAVRFCRAHAADYHLDPTRVAGLGHSSGAYLALMVGFTPGETELEGAGGWADQSSAVAAVVNISGVSDRRAALGTGTLALLGTGYETKRDLRALASPVTHVNATTPPVYTLHGEEDKTVLVDSAKQLDAALGDAKVDHVTQIVPKVGHNPINVETMASVADWLFERLKKRN